MNDTGLYNLLIAGVTYPLRFGMPANRMIFEKMADKPELLQGKIIDEQGTANVIYAGYVNGCMAQDKTPEKSFEFFFGFVEDCVGDADGEAALQDIANCFAQSRHTKKAVGKILEAAEDLKKKSLTGTK